MRIDLPVSHALIARGQDFLGVTEARTIGAIHLGTREGVDRELHHQKIHCEHDTEKGQQREKYEASGQRLRRCIRPVHLVSPESLARPSLSKGFASLNARAVTFLRRASERRPPLP